MERYSAYGRQYPTYTTLGLGRDGDILYFHTQYELVPSNYLYHFLGARQSIRDYLLDLRKGTYIGLPDLSPEEFRAYVPRNGFYPTTMKPRGEALFGKPPREPDHILHKLLRCQVEILLDHGPFQVRRPKEILEHRDCPSETKAAKRPFTIKLDQSRRLVPDITRGFSDEDTTFFVHVEVDRATERMSAAEDATSLQEKISRYKEYLDRELWREQFGFRVPPSVLILTTRQDTTTLERLVRENADGWYDRFYWLSIPKSPLPTHDLFVPWQGVGGTLNLKEVLRGQTRTSPEDRDAVARDTGERSGA
jgi:hypothetical protein